jgi:hypothetical protein
VSLRPELEGLIVPSKIYGVLAAGRPVLFVGDSEGEIGSLLRRHACGERSQSGKVWKWRRPSCACAIRRICAEQWEETRESLSTLVTRGSVEWGTGMRFSPDCEAAVRRARDWYAFPALI